LNLNQTRQTVKILNMQTIELLTIGFFPFLKMFQTGKKFKHKSLKINAELTSNAIKLLWAVVWHNKIEYSGPANSTTLV